MERKGFIAQLGAPLSIRPTLDVNGIWGGYIGEGAQNILPSKSGMQKFRCDWYRNSKSSRRDY